MMLGRFALALVLLAPIARADDPWISFDGGDGPGQGKRVVLVSGDEEYRSEESLPQLAKILSTRHGFQTTVLFAVEPDSGLVNPNRGDNIPGLAALDSADLLIIATRFRNLPDDQMAHFDAYLKAGKRTVYRFAQNGDIPAFKLGGTWRFRRSELERWIDANSNQHKTTGKGRR